MKQPHTLFCNTGLSMLRRKALIRIGGVAVIDDLRTIKMFDSMCYKQKHQERKDYMKQISMSCNASSSIKHRICSNGTNVNLSKHQRFHLDARDINRKIT
jgi:hypothetical protein